MVFFSFQIELNIGPLLEILNRIVFVVLKSHLLSIVPSSEAPYLWFIVVFFQYFVGHRVKSQAHR